MAAATWTTTPYPGANKVHALESYMSRGVGFMVGVIGGTYSGTGGMTWSGPFTTNLFVSIAPASNYLPVYNGGQVKVYLLSTATMSEVASDVEFSSLSAGGFMFLAFGTP